MSGDVVCFSVSSNCGGLLVVIVGGRVGTVGYFMF